tara:strand:+ start:547 stop:759 length:213 start_codon:yes stop_codon:yes gene_type:complete
MKLNDLIKQVNDENWPPEIDQQLEAEKTSEVLIKQWWKEDFENTVEEDAIKKLKKDQLKQVSDILDKIDN